MAEMNKVYTPSGKVIAGNIPADLSAEDIKKRQDAAKPFVAKGNTKAGMPKQEAGESVGAFATKMRLWREANATPAVVGQQKALKKLAGIPD